MTKEKEFLVQDLTIDDEYDTISAAASVQEAALKMKENGIPDLVVIDDNDQYQGVIADFDIVTGLVAEGLSPEKSKVTEIMYTIEPVAKTTPVSTAFARMRDLDVSVVPVVENDKVIGVATITDCWGYLPEEYEDLKGLIPVSNPRLFNYTFSIFMTLLYLCLGVFAPLIGIVGYLIVPIVGSTGNTAIYYMFEARGIEFWIRYIQLQDQYALLWLGLTFFGILFILLGLFSAYAIFQWAYADYHLIKVNRNWQTIGAVVGISTLLVEWLLFILIIISGALRVPTTQISFDVGGLFFTGVAILCILAAVFRDILFRESTTDKKEED